MKIAICDDDNFIVNELQKYLLDFFDSQKIKKPVISTYFDGTDLLQHSSDIDIVFLDIEMPGMNGITVGKQLKNSKKDIIIFIVTSYMDYLDEAMRFHVFRYLSKPINKNRLFNNLSEAIELYYSMDIMFAIETKSGVYNVSSHDIIFIESLNRKVIIHTCTAEYHSIKPLKYWIEKAESCHTFCLTHKSYLINMEHVTHFEKDRIYLYNDQFQAMLTVRNYSRFKNLYLTYYESKR